MFYRYRCMFFSVRNENVLLTTFFDNMERILREELQDELNEFDENGNLKEESNETIEVSDNSLNEINEIELLI